MYNVSELIMCLIFTEEKKIPLHSESKTLIITTFRSLASFAERYCPSALKFFSTRALEETFVSDITYNF